MTVKGYKLRLGTYDPYPGALVQAYRAYWLEIDGHGEEHLCHKVGVVVGVVDIEDEALCQYVVMWTGPQANEHITFEVAHRLRRIAYVQEDFG